VNKFLKVLIIIVMSLGLLIVGSHYFFLFDNTTKTKDYLKKFTPIPATHSFVTSSTKFYVPKKPFVRIVLLLHGYSGSPEEFAHVLPALERAHIPYYVPQLTGFGIDDIHLLYNVKASDWFRDVLFAYDLAASLADHVDVIGLSTGGTLALLLSEHRKIDTLILAAPNVVPSRHDMLYKRLLNTPILNQLIEYSYPVYLKPTRPGRITNADTLNQTAARTAFHYPALPTHSLIPLWQLQDEINWKKVKCKKLFLLYGLSDGTVNMSQAKKEFNAAGLHYQSIEYANSAHNIFEDNDHDKVVADVLNILAPA